MEDADLHQVLHFFGGQAQAAARTVKQFATHISASGCSIHAEGVRNGGLMSRSSVFLVLVYREDP